MGVVVQLADFRNPANDLHGVPVPVQVPAGVQHLAEFTLRDRLDLEEWASRGHRVSLCCGEMGAFAMLYDSDASCASCGVVRQEGLVLLWDCVTFADIGWFPNMLEALRAVPAARRHVPVPPVLPFTAARRHCAVLG